MKTRDDDFEKLKNELVFERVDKVIEEDPLNWASNLENIGFTWHDDGSDAQEALEEKQAVPENPDQELLVAYFDGHVPFSDYILSSYLKEKLGLNPHNPLLRRYFKQGNKNLKQLLLIGLKKRPTDNELLYDLTFFHECNKILSEYISACIDACRLETDIERFEEIALLFHSCTESDGFDALHELKMMFPADSEKGWAVAEIIQEMHNQPETIDF